LVDLLSDVFREELKRRRFKKRGLLKKKVAIGKEQQTKRLRLFGLVVDLVPFLMDI
jgi:hypothetical protein